MSGVNILQESPGFFRLHQGGLRVGEAVLVRNGDKVVEHWYLYAAGHGAAPAGYGAYVTPGPTHTGVTTSYAYSGAAPSGWNPRDAAAYAATLQTSLGRGLSVEYIVATCSAPSVRSSREPHRATTPTPKKRTPARKKR